MLLVLMKQFMINHVNPAKNKANPDVHNRLYKCNKEFYFIKKI